MKRKKGWTIAAIFLGALCFVAAFVYIYQTKLSENARIGAQVRQGQAYLAAADYELAADHFGKALSIDPIAYEAQVGLAEVYAKLGQIDQAEILLKDAIFHNGSREDAYLSLSGIYLSREDFAGARDLLSAGYEKSGARRLGDKLGDVELTIENQKILLPPLTGKNAVDGITLLKALEFTVETEYQMSDEVKEGYIIRSYPSAHAELRKGDSVKLIVSKGPQTVAAMGREDDSDVFEADFSYAGWISKTAGEIEGEHGLLSFYTLTDDGAYFAAEQSQAFFIFEPQEDPYHLSKEKRCRLVSLTRADFIPGLSVECTAEELEALLSCKAEFVSEAGNFYILATFAEKNCMAQIYSDENGVSASSDSVVLSRIVP